MITVKATREGRVGETSATSYRIERFVPFVALPYEGAKWRAVRVQNPVNGLEVDALVMDVGPWNTQDKAYVEGGARPQAESGVDMSGRKTNGAGIDLGEYVWRALKMTDNGPVAWRFLE